MDPSMRSSLSANHIIDELAVHHPTPSFPRRSRVQRIVSSRPFTYFRKEWDFRGSFNVRRLRGSVALYWKDRFHIVLHWPVWGMALLFTATYVAHFLFFAGLWLFIADRCNIDLQTFRQALYFSIETQMSIGYGTTDPYFAGCSSAAMVLMWQSLQGTVVDFAMVAVVFQRVAVSHRRADSVVFSRNAVFQVIDDRVHLLFRVGETGFQPLLQTVLQVYCVLHHKTPEPKGRHVQVSAMQLQEPDTDMLNGHFFLGLPAMVCHRVDLGSPLAPPTRPGEVAEPGHFAVRQHLSRVPHLEILAVLSGTEEASSCAVEARHSYTVDDILWDHTFAPCVSVSEDGRHSVDFEALHETVPVRSEVFSRDISGSELSTVPESLLLERSTSPRRLRRGSPPVVPTELQVR